MEIRDKKKDKEGKRVVGKGVLFSGAAWENFSNQMTFEQRPERQVFAYRQMHERQSGQWEQQAKFPLVGTGLESS